MGAERLLAIGDIHGSIGALHRLLERAELRQDDALLFLGDYIDRGENSRAVLDFLMQLEQERRCIFLKGNHEDMFLRACDGEVDDWLLWLNNGGVTTMRDFDRLLPPDHYIAWLRRLRMSYETPTHYFVHAGLRPGVPPEESTDMERLWIREPFLSSDYEWGKRVVFGHTIYLQGPLVRPNKIGIDTGACIARAGRLTGLFLPDNRFIFSRGRGKRLS